MFRSNDITCSRLYVLHPPQKTSPIDGSPLSSEKKYLANFKLKAMTQILPSSLGPFITTPRSCINLR